MTLAQHGLISAVTTIRNGSYSYMECAKIEKKEKMICQYIIQLMITRTVQTGLIWTGKYHMISINRM